MALRQADSAPLEPVVILGLLNSMAVIVANTETLLADWEALCADGDSARRMLGRISAHACVVTEALECAARDVPAELVEATSKGSSP